MKDLQDNKMGPSIWNILAFCMSYALNKSLMWGILHMIFGYIYVLYWLFTYTNIDVFIMEFVNKP